MFDLLIIGGGPAGTELALGAVRLGMRTAVIETDRLGGTCLNRGCIPTKALLHLREPLIRLEQMVREKIADPTLVERYRTGLRPPALLAFRDRQIAAAGSGLKAQLERAKVTLIRGFGVLTASAAGQPAAVRVEDRIYEAKKICLAVGSAVAVPPIPGRECPGVCTSDTFLDPAEKWPVALERIVIVGAGVIGVEMADLFHHLGMQVTLVEALDRPLANLDRGLSRALAQSFRRRGIRLLTGQGVERITESGDGLEVLVGEERLSCDAVLLATGRRAAYDGCSELDLATERGAVAVDENFRTNIGNVYAIGDCRSGSRLLAHEAMDDARQLAAIWQGGARRNKAVPSCVYTYPEMAQVGLSEAEAKAAGIRLVTARAGTLANARSAMAGGERGYVNLLFAADSRRLLGAQWLGEHATELIDTLTLAVDRGLSPDELKASIRPHPSFVEVLDQAVTAAEDKFKD